MDVNRLRSSLKLPGPAPATVDPGIDLLRRTFSPAYDRRRAIELGERSPYGPAGGRGRRLNGRDASTAPFCGDCGAIRSPLAAEPCSSCGSTQPPNLSRLNPRARHMAGESPLR